MRQGPLIHLPAFPASQWPEVNRELAKLCERFGWTNLGERDRAIGHVIYIGHAASAGRPTSAEPPAAQPAPITRVPLR